MFRATNSPILGALFDCIYSFWYNAPTLTFHLNRGTGWQQCRCIVPKAVYTVKTMLLRMREFVARNM